jgi:hypothetical protein
LLARSIDSRSFAEGTRLTECGRWTIRSRSERKRAKIERRSRRAAKKEARRNRRGIQDAEVVDAHDLHAPIVGSLAEAGKREAFPSSATALEHSNVDFDRRTAHAERQRRKETAARTAVIAGAISKPRTRSGMFQGGLEVMQRWRNVRKNTGAMDIDE